MTDKTDSKEREALIRAITSMCHDMDNDKIIITRREGEGPALRQLLDAMQRELASLAANAGSEPVAKERFSEPLSRVVYAGYLLANCAFNLAQRTGEVLTPATTETLSSCRKEWDDACAAFKAHPSPPEGMVGGWMPIETAPKDGARILLHPAVEVHDAWSKGHWSEQQGCWMVGGSASGVAHTYWLPLPPAPPTSSADSRKGE